MPTIINNAIAIDNHTENWIQGDTANGKQVLSAKLPDVAANSTIEVRASGSANGSFYYRIVETTNGATDLGDSGRVHLTDSGWHTLETTTLFRATKSQTLNFAVQIDKGDTSGRHTIFNLTLIVRLL